jgi:hypothetical protein
VNIPANVHCEYTIKIHAASQCKPIGYEHKLCPFQARIE